MLERLDSLAHGWQDCKMMQPLWERAWRFLKARIEQAYDPAIPLLGVYPTNRKTRIQKHRCTCTFIAALFTVAKI